MLPADTIDPMNNMAKLEWVRSTVDFALSMRAEAIVGARDIEKREWLDIASAAGLSRAQAVNIYNAEKAKARG